MLVLVLHDHAVDEPVGEQRIAAVEVDPVEHLERAGAHRGVVVARRRGVEDVEGRPLATGVTERVVHVVEARAPTVRARASSRTNQSSSK